MPSGQIHKRERGFPGDLFCNPAHLFPALGSSIMEDLREDNELGLVLKGLTDKTNGFLDVVFFVLRGMELDNGGFHLFLL